MEWRNARMVGSFQRMMLVALAVIAALQASHPAAPDTAHVVIVATTDVHGRALGWDYVRDADGPGGLARAATILDSLRARYAGRVILVDAGDLLQGNPFALFYATDGRQLRHPLIVALNAVGYDAVTPGNHDFDYGVDFLTQAAGTASFAYVSANVTRGGGDSLLFPSHVIVERDGVRVGITGFTTPGVMVWDRAQLLGRVRVRRVAETAAAALRGLDQAHADLRVVLIHSGLDGPSSYDTTGVGPEDVAAALARVAPPPHVVVVGHSHREMRDSVINGVHFVQPRNWARSLSVVHVALARDGERGAGSGRWRVVNVRADLIAVADVPEEPRLRLRLAAPHERVRAWAAAPIGVAGPGFAGARGRAIDTPLLDFINAAQRRRTGAELSATALFDPDAGLPEGDVRLRDVAGVYPYENTLRAVRISGRQLKDYLEHSSGYYRTYEPGRPIINDSVPGYNFDVVSGVQYVVDLTQPPGRRVTLSIQGRAVQPSDSFTLALNSYRQEGGGGYGMLAGAPVLYDRGEGVRDVLVEEIRRAGRLRAEDYFTPNWTIQPPAAAGAVLAAFPGTGRPTGSDADSTLLRVLAITDLHGALEPRTGSGADARPGAAVLKAWLDSLSRSCACPSVRLDGGDEMQGTAISALQYGRPTIDVLNRFGLDGAAIGNHEFDWSIDTLRARIAAARYPFLSANITDTTGATRPAWARPWILIERGGQRVAVIGLTRPATATSTAPANVRALRFGDMAAAVRRVLPEVRAARPHVVIVLAHEGAICEAGSCRGEIIDFARRLDSGSVDLIVAGHTHWRVHTVVNGIPIVEAASSGRAVAVADFVRVGGPGGRRDVRIQIVTPSAAVRPDPEIAALVARYAQAVDTITSRVVARLKVALPRGETEYRLGRLIADAYRAAARADVGLLNTSGIREGLPAGPVTYGQLFQVLPFQNRLVRIRVTGAVLLDALEHALRGGDVAAHVSGVEVWFDQQRPAGRRVVRARLADGRPIDRRRTYTLAVPDFLAGGGSGYAMLVGRPTEETGIVDIDAVIRYLAGLPDPVTAPTEPRLHGMGR